MRAGLYARVSTTEQAEEGYSIEAQLEAMRRYCRVEGWTVAAEYIDPGVSGTTGDRPGLQAALADCKARQIDTLLTHRLDRFYRNLRLQLETMEQLERWGISYVSVSENLDFSAPHGKMVASMMGSVNQYFIDNLRRETRKGKHGRARNGLNNASTTAYGYQRNEQGIDEIEPKAAEAVTLAFESYATGQYSDTTLADLLNRKGYKPSGRARSGRWTREGVRYLLNNPFYVGQVRHAEELYQGQHEPIISEELWNQVRALRAKRGQGRGGGHRSDRVYLLARLARCSHCGLRLVSHTSGGPNRRGNSIPYYYCPSRRRSMDCPTNSQFVQTRTIDEQVAALIASLQIPDDWRERLEELSQHRQERENVEGKRRYLQGKLRRLRDLYLEGDFEKAEYNRRKAKMQAQLDVLRVPSQPAIEEAGETLESLGAEWAGAPKRLRREMLRVIFQAVYVDVLGARLVSVKPYPQFAPLFRMDGLEEMEDGCFSYEERNETGSES